MSAEQVCIIGTGLAGLSAALYLARRNIPVTLIEKEYQPGGLASSIAIRGERIERFYHFICGADVELVRLIQQVGLEDKLHWRSCKTSYFHDHRLYPFGTPFDLLRFDPIPLGQRVRFGVNILWSRYRREWLELDQQPAKEWLIRHVGTEAYTQIWEPLLKVKFGEYHEQISAAWIWHRINRVARSRRKIWERETFGYLEGGTDTLVKRIVAELKERGATVLYNTAVERILATDGQVVGVRTDRPPGALSCQFVYSTIPLPALVELISEQLPSSQDDALKRLKGVAYIGVVCLLLHLERPVTDSFWVNVNAFQIPFNGFVEYTNLNRHFDNAHTHVLYIPFYVPTADGRFSQPDSALLDECLAGLKRIEPAFNTKWVLDYIVSRTVHAQAVCTTGFAKRMPSKTGPLKGLFLSDSSQLYPEDRTLSGAVRLGTQVAQMIESEYNRELNCQRL